MSGFVNTSGYYMTSSDMCFYFRVTKGQTYRYQSIGNRSIGAIFDSVPTESKTKCIDGTLFNPLPKQTSFVAPESGIMVIYTNLNFSQEVMDSFQVEKGTEATTVIPHQEQVLPLTLGNIELCKIGDYQDYFYKESNKWYLHKEIGKVVFNGNDDNVTYQESNHRFYKILNDIVLYSDSNRHIDNIISNRFIANKNSNNDVGYFFQFTNQLLFYVPTNIDTLEELENWLSNNNVIAYYPLATPTDTEITDTILISQLEAINNAISYEEQTNISSNTIALFSVEAYQDTKIVLEEKYTKPNTGISKTDLASAVQTSLGKADTAIQDISGKQDKTDNSLTTTNKTIPTAINEVNSIAKGANQAVGYNNYSDMITAINSMDDEEYKVGQNLYIVTVNVPDLWVSSVESTSSTYTYVDDATVINDLATNGYIQVGYYKLSMLETQKVDLTNYVTNTDYAGSNKVGVIRTNTDYGTSITSVGALISTTKTYQQYLDTVTNNMFISKGTLENVLRGYGLIQ